MIRHPATKGQSLYTPALGIKTIGEIFDGFSLLSWMHHLPNQGVQETLLAEATLGSQQGNSRRASAIAGAAELGDDVDDDDSNVHDWLTTVNNTDNEIETEDALAG
ncbi:hypothetical protein PISL3812_08355 [Talaromyces islandicus]|uniref:Uncharacterized protein n=1 Tax=Talaromyces islandicus TaxID=28573 RepID=A0A0U1M6Y3_TALIS|nr:hypothetical protein PISL3812_08355 [Talaromyces islandicus]